MIKQPRFSNTTGMRNGLHIVHQVARVMRHSMRLVLRVEPLLQVFIMGCNPGWAGVFITLQCLHANQCKHKASRRVDTIGTQAKCRSNATGINHLAGADHADALAQTMLLQFAYHQEQTAPHRQTHEIDQALGRCARTTVGTVYGEKSGA